MRQVTKRETSQIIKRRKTNTTWYKWIHINKNNNTKPQIINMKSQPASQPWA